MGNQYTRKYHRKSTCSRRVKASLIYFNDKLAIDERLTFQKKIKISILAYALKRCV